MPGGELRQPLTRAQQAFWDLQEALPNGPVNVAYYLDLSGPLDISLLSQVGREFVARMATLFIRFETTPAGVELVHDPSLDNSRTTIDFRDRPDSMAAAHEWMVADCARRIDLTRDRTALFGLFQIADDRHLIYMRGHHIICDGAAAIANLNRWGRCYTQALAGETPDYPEPADFAAALAADTDYASSTRRARDRDYWRDHLVDVEHAASLSRRYARPAPIPHRVSGRLDDATLAALREVETAQHTGMPAVIATAVAAYLSRMTGRPDVTVALPVAARTTAALRATPLPVSNVVPIRTRLEAGVDLRTALVRTQSSLLGALRHQRYRYEDIRADLTTGVGSAGAGPGVAGPVLNLMLFEPRVRFGDAMGSVQVVSAGPVDDLAITLYHQPNENGGLGTHIDLEANPGRYTHAETVDHFRRLTSVIRSMTAGLLDAPDTRVDALPLLDDAEVRALTSVAGGPEPEPRTLPELLNRAATRWPHRVALEGPAVSWPYLELARRSGALARVLSARGAHPGTVVAIATGRGVLQTLSLWAVAQTGAAILLIDPEQPDVRITRILDDAQPVVTLTAADVSQRRPDWLLVDDLADKRAAATAVSRPVHLDDTAYLVYTSGTTGRPKGVVLSHRGLAALVTDLAARLADRPVRIAQLAAPGFDATLFEHLVAVATGGTVLPAPRGIVVGRDLATFLTSRHVTHAVLTPSVLATVPPGSLDGSRLTTLMSAGEAISTTLAQTWASRHALHNLYGPAESTIMATAAAPLGRETPADSDAPSIGLPITGTRAFVLDSRLRPVPVGVAGDLYLAGPSLALGYLGATSGTAHRFVACPWGPPGTRMYRTGDLAAWQSELRGLVYLGRADGQVQIRGVRVELGDIEIAADAHPDVVAATAVLDGSAQAVTLFVAGEGPSAGLRSSLRRHLAEQLPPPMWPARIVVLDTLPITATGKVDTAALASIDITEQGAVHVPPTNEIETTVAQSVSAVLDVPNPSMLADVIELGGTSLNATQIAAEVSTRAQVFVSARDVLTATTLAELASVVGDRSGDALVAHQGRPPRPPVSPQQAGLVLESRIHPDSTANVLRGSVSIASGSLSLPALRAAIVDVVDRHEMLRTVIRADDTDLWQDVVPTEQAVRQVIIDSSTTDETLVADVSDPTASIPVRLRIIEHADDTVIDVAAHHIVVDDRSAAVLMTEVATAYAARSAGGAPQWSSTPLQYIDATLDAARRLGDPDARSSVYETQRQFWLRTLRRRDARPRLPTDVTARDSPQPPRAGQQEMSVWQALTDRIAQLATESGVTEFAVLHAALAVVVSRYTDTDDVWIAVAQAGRDRLPDRPAVGMYVNPVVIRTAIDSRSAVDVLIRESAGAIRDALRNSDIPFADVVRAVDPQREITDAALTDVWLSYRDTDHSDIGRSDGFDIRVHEQAAVRPRVPLQWNVDRVAGRLRVTVTHRADQFSPAMAATMVEAYIGVLDRATNGPDRTPAQLLPGETADPVGVPTRPGDLVAMFDETADRFPDRVALVSDDSAYTYATVRTRARSLAARLTAAGIAPGTTVAVTIPRGGLAPVVHLAVMMAGAAYVPIDITLPVARIELMLDDCAPVLVAVVSETAELAGSRPHVDCGVDATSEPAVSRPHIHPDAAAYVIFTSGSTGRPKGVAVSHRSVVAMLDATGDALGYRETDVFSCTHSLSFDFSVFEVFAAWRVGAAVVLVDVATVADPMVLSRRLVEHEVSVLSQTPSAFAPVADHMVTSGERGHLRQVVFGGETLHPRRVRVFADTFPDVALFNLYGLTEAAVHVTVTDVDPHDPRSLIGSGLGDTRLLVGDRWLQPVPAGVWGELYVSGSHLAHGYHRQAGLTAERFVASPIGPAGERLYRTGDVARRTLDGRLEYGGRADDQVQVRGFRLEFAEIAAAFRAMPGVADAVASLREPDSSSGGQLIVHVVPAPDAEPVAGAALRAAAARVLPSYAVPAHVVAVDGWPLTVSGKIDRSALPGPPVVVVGDTGDVQDGPLLGQILDVVGAVLGVDPSEVDPTRSLLDHGANSLSYMHIAVGLARATGRRLSVADLAAAQTIADVARALDMAPTVVDVDRAGAGGPGEYIPSPQQKGLWILNRLDEQSTVYHLPALVEDIGGIDPLVVRAAVGDLVERHDVLRTTFDERDGEPFALVLHTDAVAALIDAMMLPVTVDAENLDSAARAEALRPFRLTGELGWRVAVFDVRDRPVDVRNGPVDGVGVAMLLVAHHVVADGWSLDLIAADLETALAARQNGDAPIWDTAPTSYRDHARRMAAGSSTTEADIAYWRTQLADAPVHIALPRPGAAPVDRSGPEPAAHTDIDLGVEVRAAAGRRAESANTTVFHVVHVALARTLATFTGADDIVIGTPIAGRETVDDLAGVGMYVRTVVLRSRVADDETPASALLSSEQTLLAAAAHSAISYEGIAAALAPARTSDTDPYLDVILAFAQAAVANGPAVRPIRVPHARVPLEFSVLDHGPGAGMRITLVAGIWRVDTDIARRMLAHLAQAIADIAEADLDGPMPHTIVGVDHPAAASPAAPITVDPVEAILYAAESTPHAVAVIDADRALTYRELIDWADRIADTLRAGDIGVGDRVAVIASRSPGTIAAVLATMSVGAAYVPIDSSYPESRIAALVDAGDPAATITVRDDAESTVGDAGVGVELRHPGGGAHARGPVSPDTPAYVVYTSGSTGTPKGVVVTRGNFAALLAAAVPVIDADETGVWSWFHSPAFDFSVWEIFGALASGGRVVVVDGESARDPGLLLDLIEREHVTILSQTPTAFARLVDIEASGGRYASLRWVVFGGEAIIPESLHAWREATPAVGLLNMYGITETTVHLTHGIVDTTDRRSIIGEPLPGVTIMILDRRLRTVPIGARGEVYAIGDQVALGYLGETAQTAHRFVASPHGPVGARMYRTGDHARRLDDRSHQYLGRVDRQVQLRGFRIELGEVAAVLRGDPTVADVRVLVRPGTRAGDETLVAFVIAHGPGDDLDVGALQQHCATTLPAHLVPSSIHPVAAWPLTGSDKLDVAALLAALANDLGDGRPLTASEDVVAATIAAVTGVRIGTLHAASNFFDLGGNSLSAARLAAGLGEVAPTITVRDVFEHPTVAMLAGLVDRPHAAARPVGPPPAPRPRPARLPLTPQQEEIWLQWRLDPADTGYHLSTMIPLSAADTTGFAPVIGLLVDRHDALRTSYPEDADGPHQQLWDTDSIDIDLTPVAVDDIASAASLLSRPFDLTVEVPWRAVVAAAGDELVLGIAIHHIAFDGHSMAVIERELTEVLAARTAGLPEILDFASYTQWYLESLDARREVLDAFWSHRFATPPNPLRLPGVTHTADGGDISGIESAELSADDHRALRTFAARSHTTVFIVVHTALAALLARRGDTDDIVIGTATSGRVHEALADTVGMFARTVPLRTQIDLERPFTELLASVTGADLDSFAHADLPASSIAHHADPGGSSAGTAVSDVFLADLTHESGLAARAAIMRTGGDIDRPRARFGLDFALVTDDSDTRLALIHRTAMVDADTARGLIDDLVALLLAVVAAPDEPVVDHLIGVADTPGRPAERVAPTTLGDLLDDAASRHTDRIAVVQPAFGDDPGQTHTYGDVAAWAHEVADTLAGRGVGPGDLVAVHGIRSVTTVVGMWAVAVVGAAFVHLDAGDPLARRQAITADARPAVGLYAGPQAPDDIALDWVSMDRGSRRVAPLPGAPGTVGMTDLAYVTYTSGSTGTPKGVMVTHGGLADLVSSVIDRAAIDSDSVVLHNYATTFDAHLIELIPALAAGATVAVCPPEVIGGDDLAAVLTTAEVSTFFSTPSALATLDPAALTTVETVVVGGEHLPAHIAAAWSRDRRMINFYGPTETTVAVTGSDVVTGPVTIGRSLAGVVTHVLDRRLRPVPDDTIGELYIAGPGVARGYVGRADLTAERFVADPSRTGGRMYRTGDLVHRRRDGRLVIHGRSDDQLAVRGLRLEPTEIEAALTALPQVRAAAVGLQRTPAGAEVLAAWVVAAAPLSDQDLSGPDPADIRDRLRLTLPRRSIPGIITVVDALPRTPGGKLDRSALSAAPVLAAAATGTPPTTAHEMAVAKVWSEVIGIPAERIDSASDFFALGGTSLSATRATARLREHTGRPVNVRQLFDARSVRAVAALLDSLDEVAPAIPPEHLPVPNDLPLSYPQRRLWILNRIDPHSTAYTVPVVLRISGTLDVEALRTAVAELPTRHGSLRTVYPDTPDGPRQVVAPLEDTPPVAVRRVPIESVEAVIAEIVSAPFDLVVEPGFRAEILEVTGSDERLLVIAMHHVAVDGWSMRTLLDELLAAYIEGPDRDRATDLTYTDFTQWQIRRLGDPDDPTSEWSRHLRFWTDTLAGVGEPIRLPQVGASGSHTGRGGRVHTTLDDDMVAGLQRIAAAESATLFHLAHAALAALFGQWTGRHDLVIGAPVLGRSDPAWEPVVGMFVNTLALRTTLDPDASISDTLRRVRDTDLAATAHDEIPYDAVARAVRPDHHGRRDPLISVLLVQQEIGAVLGGRLDLPIDGVRVELAGSPELLVGAKFDIEVVFGRLPGEPLGITVIHSGAVPGSVAERLLDDYLATLRAVLRDPQQPFPRLDGIVAPAAPMDDPTASPETRDSGDPELAQTVRAAMAEVLGSDPAAPGLDDDFFALGGTSLSATQVVSIIGRELGHAVSVGTLFDASTPRALARAIRADGTSNRPRLMPLDAVVVPRRSEPVPLTSAQRRMWFVDQLSGGQSGAVVPLAVGVPRGVADHRVRAALRAVADRHAPLRSVYPDSPNGPVAVQLATFAPPLTVLGAVGDVDAAIATAVGAGFDITLLPPIRAVLIGADEHRILLVVVHHIAMDGQSVPILSADLQAAMAGSWLAPLDVGYPSVAAWESTIPADVRASELGYWRAALAGYPGVLDLPTDRARGVDRSTDTATFTLDLGSQSSDIRRTARTVGLTEFHVLHAALAVTLGSWAGVDDVAIGVPASLRRHPETADMVGMFTSTVVLRTEMPATTSLVDFLHRVRDTDLAALDHTLVGFDEIVAAVNPPRDAGRHPLVQVMLSLVPAEADDPAGGSTDLHAPSPHSEFDLQLTVSGSSNRLTAAFVYASDLFERTTIEYLADRWRRSLAQIASRVAEPRSADVLLDRIDLRSDDEVRAHAELATVWATRLPMTLGDVFSTAVRTHPDAVAIDDGAQTLTYADLDRWSSALADGLRGHGVGPGDPVAVALSRSAESVVALWAVARIGAVHAPIDPGQPEDRVGRMLDIIGPRAAIIGSIENRAMTTRIDIALLRVPPPPAHLTGTARWAPAPFDSVAYLVFTSGSTGVPNAVSVTHRGLSLYGDPGAFGLDATDRVAHTATPAFDAALLEILLATAAGATLVVIPPDRVGGSVGTAELVVRDITAMFITPAVLATLDPKPLAAVRTIWVGGEAVPADLVRTWNTGRRIEVVYGPTEATMLATRRVVPPSTITHAALIGDAYDTLATAVLDTHLRPVPDGVTGELYLLGPALAQGYHRADLTSARFVAAADGSRMYRTGDLVRRSDVGLEFRGRTDTQRQIRGLRVEPGEVDGVLLKCGVSRSTTLVVAGPAGDVLVSYVVGDIAATDLRAAAALQLPAHLLPAQIIAVGALPLTPNGKLDVFALPEPRWDRAGGDPRTETEATVLSVFRGVLADDTLGVDDDYFAAGGTSLQLAQVTADLQARLGTRIPIAAIFGHPSPAGLAAAIDAGTDALAALAPVVELSGPPSNPHLSPLWCVHPASGLAWSYLPLAQVLPIPVLGLQLPGLADPATPMPTTLGDLARTHIDELQRRQPSGPYRLAGWSVGGQLVHEMARQLTAAGEEVALLVLLDPRVGTDVGVDDFAAEGAGIYPEMAAQLRAIDPERFADYRRRAQILAGAAAAHEPGVVHATAAIYVAARDNTDPHRWDDRFAGPVTHETVAVDHADIGTPEAMTTLGEILTLVLAPVRAAEPTDDQENR